jgi:hypothetical protein
MTLISLGARQAKRLPSLHMQTVIDTYNVLTPNDDRNSSSKPLYEDDYLMPFCIAGD